MKILLDHCIDWRLGRSLPSHAVKSAAEMGWDALKNGKLLAAAGLASFDLLLTVDKNIKHEQNLTRLPVAVVVLIAASNRTEDLVPLLPFFESALPTLMPGALIEIEAGGKVTVIAPGRVTP
jgi:predicted nuclease of predicted toxin-antitoxin system